jgi:ribose transport system substrate-binding protein
MMRRPCNFDLAEPQPRRTMKPLRILALLLLGAAAAAVPACSGSGKTKIAFVTNNPDPFWNIVESGAKKRATKEPDIELVFQKPAQGDAAVQKEVIDSLLNQNIKAIGISVIDPKNQAKYLDEIGEKVKLLTVDNDAPNTKRKCYIGTDNYEAGRAAGAMVKKAMPEGGVIAIFVGSLEGLNAQQRHRGVLDELAGVRNATGKVYGKYRLHKTYTDQPEGEARGKENAVTAIAELENEPNVCFIGLWAYNPPGMLSAVKDKEKLGKVKLVGFDENEVTLDGVRDGHIYGTVVQQPYEFGYQSVKMMAALARGNDSELPKDKLVHVPHFAITKSGEAIETSELKDGDTTYPGKKTEGKEVEAFRKNLHEMLGK